MSLAIAPLDTPPISATDQVFDALYTAVISVQLPPGTKVSEADIAKQLGVSRQPVRDAFFRLSNLGFLSIRPQRATVITPISLTAVADAVFTRTALEVECLRTAMQQAPNDLIEALRANLAQQKDAANAKRDDFHALDEAFHETICIIAGHAHIWSLIREQKAHLDRIRFLTLSEARQNIVIGEHQDILSAIEAANGPEAEAKLRMHIADVSREIDAIRKRHPDYFD